MSNGHSSPKSAQHEASHDDDEHRVRQRAYELWQAEGAPHGRSEDHWHRARRELFGGNLDTPEDVSSPASTTLDATMGAGEAMARGEPEPNSQVSGPAGTPDDVPADARAAANPTVTPPRGTGRARKAAEGLPDPTGSDTPDAAPKSTRTARAGSAAAAGKARRPAAKPDATKPKKR
jgi:hypothetical protein